MSDFIARFKDAMLYYINQILNYLFDYFNIPSPPDVPPISPISQITSQIISVGPNKTDIIPLLIKMHNQSRSITGANPLKLNILLSNVAYQHVTWMIQAGPSILGPNNTTISDRIEQAGYKNIIVGLNVACGYSDPHTVMHQWLSSHDHRSNIQRKQFKEIGIAMANNYWCVIFARHLALTDRYLTLGYDQYQANQLTPSPIIKL